MGKSKKYTVQGTHRVREVKPGEPVELDPSDPQTVRLLARGQVALASSRQSGVASTEDGPDTGTSEKSEE
jgi:hypothetical protein